MKYVFLGKETVTNIDDVFDIFEKGFELPDYFGRNIDALYDCLSVEAEQRLIVIADKEYLTEILGRRGKALFTMIEDADKETASLVVREFE